jgi:hypothetical protein
MANRVEPGTEDRAGTNDVPADAPRINPPAEPSSCVAKLPSGRSTEVEMHAATWRSDAERWRKMVAEASGKRQEDVIAAPLVACGLAACSVAFDD